MKKFLLLIIALLMCNIFYGQTTVTLGTGTSYNTYSGYPCPYGFWYNNNRTQYLILASELNSLGLGAGNITKLAFNVYELNDVGTFPNSTLVN